MGIQSKEYEPYGICRAGDTKYIEAGTHYCVPHAGDTYNQIVSRSICIQIDLGMV